MSSASAPFFLSAATAVALATNQTNYALVAYPSLHLATGMMPTQFSTLSPPDSPADRLHLPCFLSRNSHLSCRSFLLLPLPLLSPFFFFPSPSPPLSASTFAAPHPSSASIISSAPPSHPVAEASLPDSSYRTKGDDGDVQIGLQYMLVVGGGLAGRRGVAGRGTCGWATMETGCRHDNRYS